MPYKINWYVPGRVICATFWGEVSLEDFGKYNHEMTQILETAASRIHVIVDALQVMNVSANPREIIQTLSYLNHPQIGWGTIIQSSRFVRFVASMVMQMKQVRVRYFGDIPSAVTFLEQIDDTIHWEQIDKGVKNTPPT